MSTINHDNQIDHPANSVSKPPSPDVEKARERLEDGNRMFAGRMRSSQNNPMTTAIEPRDAAPRNGLEAGMVREQGGIPRQEPFAVVIGCSDARVPMEMVFGQGFNDLFVIRVAGNVIGDVCQGSVDFAVDALRQSVKVLVVLGHSNCGAVAGAVAAYLTPREYWSRTTSPSLRSILQKIFISVREAANCIDEVWGPEARNSPGYRQALTETSVALNAAHAAFSIRQEIENSGHGAIEVFYGVYNLGNHQVRMPNNPSEPSTDETVNLALSPSNPGDFHALGIQMAELLKPTPGPSEPNALSSATSPHRSDAEAH